MSNPPPKVAVVTGSTSGIGLGIAQELATQGCRVVVNSFSDRSEDHAIAAQMCQEKNQVVYKQANMESPRECADLVTFAKETFGRVDILVNNAGIQHVAPVELFPVEKWDSILAINLSSAFHTSRTAIPFMKHQGWGRIINIASAHGLTASPYKSAYIAAKHGLVGLTKTIALEFAEAKINATCNALCPAYVLTPLVENQLMDQMKTHSMTREDVIEKIMLVRQPTRHFVQVDEVAAFAAFLCTDKARQITGAALPIDGGWTAL